jgi:hypothetical protein
MLTSLLCKLMVQPWICQHSSLCTTQHAHHDFRLFVRFFLLISSRDGKA